MSICDLLEKYPTGLADGEWDMQGLSENPSMTLEFVERHSDHFNYRSNVRPIG
jgi:hypothetical protein